MKNKKWKQNNKSVLWGRGKDLDEIKVLPDDLRALLFWSTIGVSKCRGGTYERDISNVIESYAENLGFVLPEEPSFK